MARVVSVRVPKDVSEKMLCIGLLKVFRVGLRRESFSGIEEEYRRKVIALALGSGVLFEIAMVGVGRCS